MNFYILIVLAMVIWGASWGIAKLISSMTSVVVILFWRNILTFLALIPILFILKEKPKLSYKALSYSILGALVMTAYNYLFFKGLEYGLAGAGGILVTTLNPIFNFLLVSLLSKKRIELVEKFALGLGLLGGLILLKIWDLNLEDILKSGNLFFLIASLAWAFLSILTERSSKHSKPLLYSFYNYAFASLLTFIWVLPYPWVAPLSFGFNFWLPMFYLSVISTAFATTIYFIASSKLGSHVASSYIFIVPTSAMFFAWIIQNEKIQLHSVTGGILALLAAVILHKFKISKSKKSLNL